MFQTTHLTDKAYQIACSAHSKQTDKAGAPYINHPMHVALQFLDEVLIAAALLHDVLEDTPWTAQDLIDKGIPQEVVEIVRVLTKAREETYAQYISRVSKYPNAAKIKIADLMHNADLSRLSSVSETDLSRQKKYLEAIRTLMDAID